MEIEKTDMQPEEINLGEPDSNPLSGPEVSVNAMPSEVNLLEGQNTNVEHSPHHWIIPADAPEVIGCCKECGAERKFSNKPVVTKEFTIGGRLRKKTISPDVVALLAPRPFNHGNFDDQ